MRFLENKNILTEYQSCFRKNRSTTDQLIRLESYIREAFVTREHVVPWWRYSGHALVKKPLPWSLPCLKFGIISTILGTNGLYSADVPLSKKQTIKFSSFRQNFLAKYINSQYESRLSKSKVPFHSDKNPFTLTAQHCLLNTPPPLYLCFELR